MTTGSGTSGGGAFHLFYVRDMLDRPTGPDRVRWPGRELSAAEMPFIEESWQRFYGADGPGAGLGPYEP